MNRPHQIRILLLEDNPDDVFLMRMALTRAPVAFVLLHADRLRNALRLLEENVVDIILTDLNLPDSAGAETVKQLVAHAHGVPVVVLTGYDDQMFGEELLKQGACDYWSKNRLTDPDLVRAIEEQVRRAGSPP